MASENSIAVDAPKPSEEPKAERHEFVFTGEHLVVNNGGSAKGMTAVVKRRTAATSSS